MSNTPSLLNIPKKLIDFDYLRILACLGVFACHLWVGSILPVFMQNQDSLTSLPAECLGIHGDALYQCGLQTFFLLPNDNFNHFLFNIFNILFGLGYQGVHLFFFLSGFGLTFSALNSIRFRKNKINWFDFLKKRFLRLYPSYWMILAFFLLLNFVQYETVLGLLKTYVKGAIFLDVIPATWFMPILLQLYLLFPFLFYLLKKFKTKHFIILTLLFKVISSAVIIIGSEIIFNKIIGFGNGGLAPGGIGLTRLFEFCFGMTIAKLFVDQEYSMSFFKQFRKPSVITLGFILEILRLFLSLKYTQINFLGHFIPVGLFISDALIGVGIFILGLNFVIFISRLLQKLKTSWVEQVSNGTYEAYLVHGCLLSYFGSFMIQPFLTRFKIIDNSLILGFTYLIFLAIFSIINLVLGLYILNLKTTLSKKITILN